MSIAAGFGMLAFVAGAAPPVHASDRWEQAARGAVAILPAPARASSIVGGSLFCAEQQWGLLLRAEPGSVADGLNAPVNISVGRDRVPAKAVFSGSTIYLALPSEILEPMKAANLMRIEIGGSEDTMTVDFSLRGSRDVIEIIAPLCSQIDMAAYEEVRLSENDENIAVAQELRADEAKLFRAFTGNRPVFTARTADLADGKSLLFVALCGSNAYYGQSGCSLAGYVRGSLGGEWREAYETEGVHLYLDRAASNNGFPDLMTLPVVHGLQPTRWSWTGAEYGVSGDVVAEQQEITD